MYRGDYGKFCVGIQYKFMGFQIKVIIFEIESYMFFEKIVVSMYLIFDRVKMFYNGI